MSIKKTDLPKKVVEAAGGILWKETPSGQKIVIIHRKRYDDWSLPKGKKDPDESWQETALREVWEETNCRAILGKFIGSSSYTMNGQTPKVVLFWQMALQKEFDFKPNSEVDRIKWISPKKALKQLSYNNERNILNKAIKLSMD